MALRPRRGVVHMSKPAGLIMVGAEWEKASGQVKRVCEQVSQETNSPFEYREEDWNFLMDHGERDEFGGVNIPQVFVKYDDGKIRHVMSRLPLTDQGRTDSQAGAKQLREALERREGQPEG